MSFSGGNMSVSVVTKVLGAGAALGGGALLATGALNFSYSSVGERRHRSAGETGDQHDRAAGSAHNWNRAAVATGAAGAAALVAGIGALAFAGSPIGRAAGVAGAAAAAVAGASGVATWRTWAGYKADVRAISADAVDDAGTEDRADYERAVARELGVATSHRDVQDIVSWAWNPSRAAAPIGVAHVKDLVVAWKQLQASPSVRNSGAMPGPEVFRKPNGIDLDVNRVSKFVNIFERLDALAGDVTTGAGRARIALETVETGRSPDETLRRIRSLATTNPETLAPGRFGGNVAEELVNASQMVRRIDYEANYRVVAREFPTIAASNPSLLQLWAGRENLQRFIGEMHVLLGQYPDAADLEMLGDMAERAADEVGTPSSDVLTPFSKSVATG